MPTQEETTTPVVTPETQSQVEEANILIGELNPELEKEGVSQLPTIGGGPTVLSSENGKDTMTEIEETIAPPPEDTTEEVPPVTAEDTLLQQEIDAGKDAATLRAEEKTTAVTDFFAEQSKTLNASRKKQLSNITSQFKQFARKTEQSTKRRVKLQETIGARFGGRFTIEHTADLVKEQVDIGIQALEALAVRENTAKGKINDAFDTKDNARALKEFNVLQAIIKQKEEKFDEIEKMQQDALKLQQEEEKKLGRQELIAEELDKGLTSALDIFTALNGEIPFDEITAITDELGLEDAGKDFTLSGADIRFDAEGKVIARGSKVGTGLGTGGAGGGGGGEVLPDVKTATADERRTMERIIRQLPVKLKDNVAERPILEQNILADIRRGMSFQEIADEMKGFVVQNEEDMPLASTLRIFAVGSDVDLGEVSAAINSGSFEQAMLAIENAQLGNVDSFFAPTDKARSTIKQGTAVLNILNDPDFPKEKLGAFDAVKFKFDKVADTTNADDIKIQQLESALQLLNAPIRVEIVGTAATEAEMSKITGFQAGINDQPDIVETQVTELVDSVLRFHNEARGQRGLPVVTVDQLGDNTARLGVYQGIADEKQQSAFDSMSNSDLDSEIDKELGEGSTTSLSSTGLDDNGFPI